MLKANKARRPVTEIFAKRESKICFNGIIQIKVALAIETRRSSLWATRAEGYGRIPSVRYCDVW